MHALRHHVNTYAVETPKGVINMADCLSIKEIGNHPKYEYLFAVYTKSRNFYMAAYSREDMALWLRALNRMHVSQQGGVSVYPGTKAPTLRANRGSARAAGVPLSIGAISLVSLYSFIT